MAKNDAAYWEQRAAEAKRINAQTADQTARYVEQEYRKAMKDIQDRIDLWYQRFASNEGITLAEAHQVLTSDELARFRMDLQEYIEACMALGEDVDPEWLKILENASAVHHIERFEAIKIQTQQALEILAGKQRNAMDEGARNSYKEGLLHTIFSLQDSRQAGYTFYQIDEGKLNRVIKRPWAPDGEGFSDRIWKDKKKLVRELHTTMTQHCITGASVDKVAKELAAKLDTSKYNAKRLVQTESAHFAAEGDLEGYKETDVEQYQWLAGLDHKTCTLCAELDKKVFNTDEAEEGATLPPRHPNCRCTTIPYFEDEFTENDTRAARDPKTGKTVQIPDMDYADWKKKYVDRVDTTDDIKSFAKGVAGEERERRIHLGEQKEFDSDYGSITASRIKNSGNNLFLEDGVHLTHKDMRDADRMVSTAKELLGITYRCRSPVVIVETNKRLASYNPRTDTITISKEILNSQKVMEIQAGFVCPENPNSTLVHELIHWKDADQYRQQFGAIVSSTKDSEYTRYQNKQAREALLNEGIDLTDLNSVRKEISYYAYKKSLVNDYEEVYTEYRTKKLLKG